MIEIAEDKKESASEKTNEINRIVKKAKEKQNAADTMQDWIYDQRTVSLGQSFCKRGIEAKETFHNKIENINNKMLQSIEEKDETIMETLEETKEIAITHPRESKRKKK